MLGVATHFFRHCGVRGSVTLLPIFPEFLREGVGRSPSSLLFFSYASIVRDLEMEASKACSGDTSSDSGSKFASSSPTLVHSEGSTPLPLPPISLLNPPNSLDSQDLLQTVQRSRVRSFPHVDVCIPFQSKKELAAFLKKVSSQEPSLHAVDVDLPLNILHKNEEKLERAVLGREFHISLGRTVPIRVHQIDSMVSMLRQKLQTQQGYWIDFSKWEIFVNDDHTRTFLSLEVVQGGLREITKQIEVVNGVYKLHNLPEFYKDPRPHISLAWALGDIGHSLKKVVEEIIKSHATEEFVKKCAFTYKFKRIKCKIGCKTYKICKVKMDTDGH
ncbi:U6 snRNA phosphodiesterase-like isoform X2 [Neltuma alba]|uniref:U6 snRNA phosphodiesterase-like isoform X2 n=1 Tax=Neltuma alba TaxID=207710 RepID=UPI0010A5886D|nr:U6 snRNA phosphodiesterase-like isoform X2 [Prosopis alba]